MCQVGDLIYYGSIGVCRITDIAEPNFSGAIKGTLYYTLKPLYQECTIRTPVNNDKVFMRPIISKDEAERLIDMIPSIHAKPYHSRAVNQLSEHYEMLLKTHDCADLIELIVSIDAKKQKLEEQNRKFGTVDEKYMKRAKELVSGELSAALGISKGKVPAYISTRVGALTSGMEKIAVNVIHE